MFIKAGDTTDNKLRKTHEALLTEFESKIKFLSVTLKELSTLTSVDSMRKQKTDALSVVLRNLLIDSKRQTSLISVIGVANKFFFKQKSFILSGMNNTFPESSLTSFGIRENNLYFKSKFEASSNVYIGLDFWLNEIVLDDKSPADNLVSRKEIILAIADKEAAHTDLEYESKYYKISSENKMNITLNVNNVIYKPVNNIYYESLITIAYELVESFSLYKSLINITPQVATINREYYVLHEIALSERKVGYRINRWVSGHVTSGASALNILVFESKNIISYRLLGNLQMYRYKSDKIDVHFIYIDFSINKHRLVMINCKEPFCLVAILTGKTPRILSGSRVSINSTLSLDHYLFPGKDWIIKDNIDIHNDIFKIIGIPPLDINFNS